ncbi:MAG: hypothetical protein ABI690_26875 [Chloroflexota bacterium]
MFNWLEYATRLKQKEFYANAEEAQLIREALAAHANDDPFYYEALAALGRRLAALGENLQERYDSACKMPLELPPLERAHE